MKNIDEEIKVRNYIRVPLIELMKTLQPHTEVRVEAEFAKALGFKSVEDKPRRGRRGPRPKKPINLEEEEVKVTEFTNA